MESQEKGGLAVDKASQAWIDHLKWLGIKVEAPRSRKETSR